MTEQFAPKHIHGVATDDNPGLREWWNKMEDAGLVVEEPAPPRIRGSDRLPGIIRTFDGRITGWERGKISGIGKVNLQPDPCEATTAPEVIADEICEHTDRVYSGEFFARIPALWFWVCEGCGETGIEMRHSRPSIDPERFAQVVDEFGLGPGPYTSTRKDDR